MTTLPLFSPYVIGQSIDRYIQVLLDPAGVHSLTYNTRTRVVQRGTHDILEIDIPDCLRNLWDIICDQNGYVDFIVGPTEQGRVQVRWSRPHVCTGLGNDGSMWTVWFLNPPAVSAPIPVFLS